MFRIKCLFVLLIIGELLIAQNDLDAIRYSRYGVNGSSRFVALGGAFGAIGADISCAAYNPAGLALYRKREFTFSGGIRTTNNTGIINSNSLTTSDAAFIFNNAGYLTGWTAKNDPESRNVISISCTQTQNFLNKTSMSSYNTNSIAKDMLNKANLAGNSSNLNSSYEGLGYDTYLLDYDSASAKFFSFVDLKKSVLQTRDIVTSGKSKEWNFSYAYAYKDKFYLGLSLGVPRVEYTSTTTHTERDDKDSMRVTQTSDSTYSTTYTDGLPFIYTDKLGFNSLTYTEYFKTTGTGLNLKLGGIARITDYLRVGLYYHTPTIYNLTDQYYYTLSTAFDKSPSSPVSEKYPADGGYFNYKIIAPARISLNTAIIIKRITAIGIDYEIVNYKNSSLGSVDISDFAGVNAVIKDKYKIGQNLRVGAEFNIKPVMLRAGYNMQSSPFGNSFSGTFVRQSFSIGAGFVSKNNVYFDVVWVKTLSTEDYYLYNTLPTKATIKYNSTTVSATIGVKF